jgi:4'-phosphopantetheinyl transferase
MNVDNEWLPPPIELTLADDEIHIWRAPLDQIEANIKDFHQTLSDQERLRASRYRFKRDRQGYVIRHGILRIILGRYLGVEPSDLSYGVGEFGKPHLQDEINPIQLRFNLSHSHRVVVFAFSRVREIGVDLEYIHPLSNFRDIAAKFFAPNENKALSTLPDAQALLAFYHCWTRKEAYIKATGRGLQIPLDRFDVSLMPGEPARLVSVSGDPQEVNRWQLREFSPARGYVAAIAVEGFDGPRKFWQWK